MTKTANEELQAVRILLGDAAGEVNDLSMTTVARVGLLNKLYQAEKAAERAVAQARKEAER